MRSVLLRLVPLVLCQAVLADTVDFEGLAHGEIVRNQIPGLSVRARNVGGGPNLAIIFDSGATGTRDPDLEDPWSGGNLPSNTDLGNVLIIAENATDANHDGILDYPDDEGSRPAGWIKFVFDDPIEQFGIDLVDIDDAVLEDGKFVFRDVDGTVVMYGFDELGNRDPSIVWGDNTINRIRPFTAGELEINEFDKVWVVFGGSGAVDNIVYGALQIPEPTALALGGLALAYFVVRRRRRVTST